MNDSLLSHIQSLRGEPIAVEALWSECSVLRRNGATWPPETEGQLREQLRALERAGLAEVKDGQVVMVFKRLPVQPQGMLF